MPEWYLNLLVIVFGLVIGSFLNVVIYRFHTGKSLNDRSHCMSCGTGLKWYELFPVISYVALLGRCRSCGAFIPYRYALVEILTAVMFWLTYMKFGLTVYFFITVILMCVLIVGLVYDLYHMIIPDEVSALAAILAGLLVGWQSVNANDLHLAIQALLASVAAFLLFGSLWFFSKGRGFGLGDAKLAISLGALVGLGGLFSFITLSFWIGALVGVSIMLWQAYILNMKLGIHIGRRVNMKSEIPFAPFLLIAFGLVFFFSVDITTFLSTIF